MRKSSRRRDARSAPTATAGSECRSTVALASVSKLDSGRATRSASSANIVTKSGARRSSSVAYLLELSTWARRWAAADSSRSRRRYQGVEPKSSLTRRKPRSPESGSGPSANQPNMTGRSVRWIAARLLTPLESTSRCFRAPTGSTYPRACKRCCAASGVSLASPASSLATACKSGR